MLGVEPGPDGRDAVAVEQDVGRVRDTGRDVQDGATGEQDLGHAVPVTSALSSVVRNWSVLCPHTQPSSGTTVVLIRAPSPPTPDSVLLPVGSGSPSCGEPVRNASGSPARAPGTGLG